MEARRVNIDGPEDLRALVKRLADEQVSMQERMFTIPQRDLKQYLDQMDLLASRLSRLAAELIEREVL